MFKYKRKFAKKLYVVTAIAFNIALWQNCAPTFTAQNNLDGNGLSRSSSINIPPDSSSSLMTGLVVNDREISRYLKNLFKW